MLEVTHHSGRKKYLNPEHVWTVETNDSGETVITPVGGGIALSVMDNIADVLAALGHKVKKSTKLLNPPMSEPAQPEAETKPEPDIDNDPDIIPPRMR